MQKVRPRGCSTVRYPTVATTARAMIPSCASELVVQSGFAMDALKCPLYSAAQKQATSKQKANEDLMPWEIREAKLKAQTEPSHHARPYGKVPNT